MNKIVLKYFIFFFLLKKNFEKKKIIFIDTKFYIKNF
jgi:hypothetical protein